MCSTDDHFSGALFQNAQEMGFCVPWAAVAFMRCLLSWSAFAILRSISFPPWWQALVGSSRKLKSLWTGFAWHIQFPFALWGMLWIAQRTTRPVWTMGYWTSSGRYVFMFTTMILVPPLFLQHVHKAFSCSMRFPDMVTKTLHREHLPSANILVSTCVGSWMGTSPRAFSCVRCIGTRMIFYVSLFLFFQRVPPWHSCCGLRL